MSNFEPHLALTHILSRLMTDNSLRESDLVKATGLPYTTISNILRGKSKNPRPATLKALADLFGITMEQLVGYEALATPLPSVASVPSLEVMQSKASSLAPRTIPLIKWDEVKPWLLGQRAIKTHTVWIANDTCKSPKAFALKVKPSMRWHLLSTTEMLLVDPEVPLEDGVTILVFLDDCKEPSLRLLTVDGKEKWLKPLEKGRPSITLRPEHFIAGTVVEVRFKPGIQ